MSQKNGMSTAQLATAIGGAKRDARQSSQSVYDASVRSARKSGIQPSAASRMALAEWKLQQEEDAAAAAQFKEDKTAGDFAAARWGTVVRRLKHGMSATMTLLHFRILGFTKGLKSK